MKKCSKCSIIKPLTEFGRFRQVSEGYLVYYEKVQSRCKSCNSKTDLVGRGNEEKKKFVSPETWAFLKGRL